MTTKQVVAGALLSYLQHQTTLAELVDWAEDELLGGNFPEEDTALLTQALARLGVADVRQFGLSWEDCEKIFQDLGFTLRVQMLEHAA